MRKVLSTNQQVAHYFAANNQSEGSCSNFYFKNDRLYSYGSHFCIARRLPSGVIVFTTRTYGQSTSKHLAYARSALNHLTKVYCNDPDDNAASNKRAALAAIESQLTASGKPRIREATREGHKLAAMNLADRFNDYLAALPEAERVNVEPFDEAANMEELRLSLVAAAMRKAAAEKAAAEKAAADAQDYINDWRNDQTMYTQGMHAAPPALRIKGDDVETSHGARIPVSAAVQLWPLIVAVKSGRMTSDDAEKIMRRIGNYSLTTIRANGSIVVGCHDIAFAEIERISFILGLSKTVAIVGGN